MADVNSSNINVLKLTAIVNADKSVSGSIDAPTPLSGFGAPASSTKDGYHNLLTNRDLPDQHPIGAITGLQEALDTKIDDVQLDKFGYLYLLCNGEVIKGPYGPLGGEGGGLGFVDWTYDDDGYLHLLDINGADVLDPLYVPGLNALIEADLEKAKEIVAEAEAIRDETNAARDEAAQHKADAEASANQSATNATDAAASASEARNAANDTQQYVQDAIAAADEVRELAEAADLLSKLGDIEDLANNAERARLYAKAAEAYSEEAKEAAEGMDDVAARAAASEAAAEQAAKDTEETALQITGYIQEAKDASAGATDAKTAAEEAAERAEAAAAQSVTNVDEAVNKVNEARDSAIETIQTECDTVIQAASDAETHAAASKTSAEEAAASADAAAESEDNAAMYAEAAQQIAEKNGYFYFEIIDGRLIETRTDNVSEDLNFTISEEGRLILEYAE